MICEVHKLFFPTKRCPICEKEQNELKIAICMAEIENSQPIVVWEGKN